MMRRVLVVLLAVGMLVGLSFTGFVAPEKVKIGALYSFTGALGPWGKALTDASQLAVNQVNAAGGVFGRQVELVVRDTATSPDVGRDAAKKLVEIDKVPAIIGPVSSGVGLAASSVTIPAQVVLISPCNTSPALTTLDDNDYYFRTVISDAMQGLVQARLALLLNYGTVSVIYVNNAYGKGIAEIFKGYFESYGGKVLAMVPYEENKPSYRGEVEKAMAGNPDAIVVESYVVDGNKQIVEAAEAGYTGKFLMPDGMKSEKIAPGPACLSAEEGGPLEGAYGTVPSTPAGAIRTQFDADFEALHGGPSVIAFYPQAYDAAAVVALAAARAAAQGEKITGTTIRDNLRAVANPPGEVVTYNEFAKAFDLLKQGKEINYEGVSGPVDFDEVGDMVRGTVEIWGIQGCQIKTIMLVPVEKVRK